MGRFDAVRNGRAAGVVASRTAGGQRSTGDGWHVAWNERGERSFVPQENPDQRNAMKKEVVLAIAACGLIAACSFKSETVERRPAPATATVVTTVPPPPPTTVVVPSD
jgi:hypothetical protein